MKEHSVLRLQYRSKHNDILSGIADIEIAVVIYIHSFWVMKLVMAKRANMITVKCEYDYTAISIVQLRTVNYYALELSPVSLVLGDGLCAMASHSLSVLQYIREVFQWKRTTSQRILQH